MYTNYYMFNYSYVIILTMSPNTCSIPTRHAPKSVPSATGEHRKASVRGGQSNKCSVRDEWTVGKVHKLMV